MHPHLLVIAWAGLGVLATAFGNGLPITTELSAPFGDDLPGSSGGGDRDPALWAEPHSREQDLALRRSRWPAVDYELPPGYGEGPQTGEGWPARTRAPTNCKCHDDELWTGRYCHAAGEDPRWHDGCRWVFNGHFLTDTVNERFSRCPQDHVCEAQAFSDFVNPHDPHTRPEIWCRHKDTPIDQDRRRQFLDDFVSVTNRWTGGRFDLNQLPQPPAATEEETGSSDREEGEISSSIDMLKSLTQAYAVAKVLQEVSCDATIRVRGAAKQNVQASAGTALHLGARFIECQRQARHLHAPHGPLTFELATMSTLPPRS